MVPYDKTEGDNQETGGAEEERDAVEEQGGGGESKEAEALGDGGNENQNEKDEEGGSDRKEEVPTLQLETYKEAVKKSCLELTDFNVVGVYSLHLQAKERTK